MYLRDVMASLLRRWYLVIVAVLLTGVAAGYVAQRIGPTYSMTASVVLIPPQDPSGQVPNRYLSLGQTGSAAQVLIRSLNSDPTHHEVLDGIPGADYVVAPDATSSAPIILVTATAKSPQSTRTVLAAALARAPQNLAALQRNLGIATNALIQSEEVSQDRTPAYQLKPQLRPSVTAGVLLFAVLAALIAGIDALVSPRRGPRREGAARIKRLRRTKAPAVASIAPAEKEADEPPRSERRFR